MGFPELKVPFLNQNETKNGDSSIQGSASSGSIQEDGKALKKFRFHRPLAEVKLPLMKDTTMGDLWMYFKIFMHSPLHVAMFFWCILATIATIALLLIQFGLLDFIEIFESEEVRDEWIEACNQIVMALFVLMCLVFHPNFFRHSFLLYRWTPKDNETLREEFCKGGAVKPDERKHILIVNIWAQLTCFGTYALAVVYWTVPTQSRDEPPVVVALVVFNLISWISPAMALVHMAYSPLGRDYQMEDKSEQNLTTVDQPPKRLKRFLERTSTFTDDSIPVESPEWQGSVFPGCCNNPKVAILTCLFPFCVFGSNMQRLGFGHSWVQTATFILMIFGPMFVFQLSAETLWYSFISHRMIAMIGVGLAVLGLGYGSAWRIRMREQYKLPAYTFCFNHPRTTDFFTWIFCSYCALCQEVRTAEYYQIEDMKMLSHSHPSFSSDVENAMEPPAVPCIED